MSTSPVGSIDLSTLTSHHHGALWYIVACVPIITLVYVVQNFIYNVFYHPLASYPGPLLARASLLWRLAYSMRGRFHRVLDEQHKRYGPVIRVSPNELSFMSVGSWKDIYGFKPEKGGREPCTKSDFYQMYGSGYNSLCVGSEQDPVKHAVMKRNLSPAFSTRALLDQEVLINEVVKRFMTRMVEAGVQSEKGLDMTKWYQMFAFDLFGELAFGESFHALESGKPHFWSKVITEHLFFITVLDNLRRWPILLNIGKRLLPWATTKTRDKHSGYTRDRLHQRLNATSPRKDFLTEIIDKVESGEIGREEMTAHTSTLVIAGGETTATFLASYTAFLLQTPHAYDIVRKEIRDAYKSIDDIDAASALKLPYLQATISEGLRIHPPGSHGFPRISPGMFIDGNWVPKGTEVYTSGWSVTHNAENFHEPFVYKPERWIDPACKDNRAASRPFSLGPRECLGKNFAMVQVSLLLAKLHFTFDMELLDKSLDWEANSHIHVMWWKPPLPVRMIRRV